MEPDNESEQTPLPALREDLQIMEGAREIDGSKTWLIYDPLRARYFQITEIFVNLLNLWALGSVEKILENVTHDDHADDDVTRDQLEELIRFLFANALTRDPLHGDVKTYVAQAEAQNLSALSSLVHHYLFFRIPLLHPHLFLKRTVHYTSIFFTHGWWACMGFLALLSLYLVGRQWDDFTNTFLHFFNFKGLIFYILALLLVKMAHELGHAYAATRYGGRVTTMGVAFLVMFPVLFTDTTDSWKLTDRRKRLVIDAAGVGVELTIAVFATLAWVFLPDSVWRSAAFFIATTSWVMSLAVNLNPLMRFDGYHFLSDLIGVQNLQERSFALGRWAMREIFFDLQIAPPELTSFRRRVFLIGLAWATWVYRFFLFLGIAILVHAIFFKALGIALFIVEIAWFIALPIFSELKKWWGMRDAILAHRRYRMSAALLALIAAFFFAPIHTTIKIPAVLEAENQSHLFAPQYAIVKTVHVANGVSVAKGDPVITFVSSALENKIQQNIRRTNLTRQRLSRIAADAQDRSEKIVLQRELARLLKTANGLHALEEALIIRAPFDGVVLDIDPNLHAGRGVSEDMRLASVIAPKGVRIRGYVAEADVLRIEEGSKMSFIPEHLSNRRVSGRVRTILPVNSNEIALPALASRFGGSIAVKESGEGLVPLDAWYSIVSEPDNEDLVLRQRLIGQVHAKGEAQSLAALTWRRLMHVFIRETTF